MGFYDKSIIEKLLNEWHITELDGCEAIPDPYSRKFCWLVLVEPELLDTLIINITKEADKILDRIMNDRRLHLNETESSIMNRKLCEFASKPGIDCYPQK